MALVYVGEATFVDKDPVDLTEHAPREWSPRGKMPKIYWYVRFRSLERAEYGLALLRSGPRSKWLDHKEVREVMFEPTAIAPYFQFSEGLSELQSGHKYGFEEVPFVEVENEEDYNLALVAFLENQEGPRDWSPEVRKKKRIKEESNWKGPGLYDFRDMTRGAKSVEEYEKDSMEYWAKDALDSSYDDDWEPTLHKLLERNI